MKKNYNYRIVLMALFTTFLFSTQAQVLTPFTGSNSISPGSAVTLCSHAGCGSTYSPYANGYTVIYPGTCSGSAIDGSYYIESCCDDINIYDGVGTGGTLLFNYAGTGVVNFTAAIGQTITVEFKSDGSVQYTGFQFTVNTGPAIDVNSSVLNYTICSGTALNLNATGADTYTWDSGEQTSSLSIEPYSTTTYTVNGLNLLYPTCPLTTTVYVEVNPSPTVTISGDTVRCGNAAPVALLINGPADNYLWSDGTTNTSILVSPLMPTTYSVVATNTIYGCSNSDSFTVYYSPAPVIAIFAPTTAVCQGGSINLFATGADSYTWSTGPETPLVTITPQTTSTITVIGQNSYGCNALANQGITVYPLPNISASASSEEICMHEPVTLSAGGADSYVWMSNSLYLSGQEIVAMPLQSTTYSVTGTNANGCSKMNTVMVSVNGCDGIAKVGGQNGFLAYPNPAKNQVTLDFGNTLDKSVEIMDLTGRIILKRTTSEQTLNININEFANGVYYIKAVTGNSVQMVKLIKD